MPEKKRYEYHWLRNKVSVFEIERPAQNRAWRFNTKSPTLICVVEKDGPTFNHRNGPAYTQERFLAAVEMYKLGEGRRSVNDLGKKVPVDLARQVSSELNEVLSSVPRKYDSFARETSITSFLAGTFQDIGDEKDGWSIGVKSVDYNPEVKEPKYGADMGVVFEIATQGIRTLKAMWFQAKRSSILPKNLWGDVDLDRQIKKMLRHSTESFSMVYTESKTHIFDGQNQVETNGADLMFDGITCNRGDLRPAFVVLASDCKLVLDFEITEI